MQLSLIDKLADSTSEPTIGSLAVGQVFARRKITHAKYLYMVVSVCGDINYKVKDDRDVVILNLVTGRVFSAYSTEEIDPRPNATILEDCKFQLKPQIRKELGLEK